MINKLSSTKVRIRSGGVAVFVLLSLFLFYSLSSIAYSFSGLEAYKLELEGHTDSKIRQAVKAILREDQYSLSVAVEMKSSAEIANLLPTPADAVAPEAKEPALGTDSMETFEMVDQKPQDEELLLPLTKLGLWQKRIMNKTKPESTDGTATDTKKSPPTYFSYRDFVGAININMYLDQGLPLEVTELVERVVRGAVSSTEGRLNFQFGKLSLPKAKENGESPSAETKDPKDLKESKDPKESTTTPPEKEKTWLDYLVEFKMPIAMLLCALTVFALGLLVTSNLNKLSLRKMNLMEKQAEREEVAFKKNQFREEEKQLQTSTIESPLEDRDLEEKRGDIRNKMVAFVEQNPREAALMVRRWILFRGEGANEALNFLARTISVNQMKGLLEQLPEEDRRSWNQMVSHSFGARDEKVALAFAETQMLVNIIYSTPKVDEDLKDLIYSLSLAETIAVIRKNQELGAVLILFLQSSQLAKVFEALEVEMISKISQIGVQFSPLIVEAKVRDLFHLITDVKNQLGTRSPFVDKLQGLLREIAPEKESPLFLAMATQLDRKSFLDFSRSHFPAELIPRIPSDLLKRTLTSMTLIKRAEMILSQSDERRNFLLSLVGEGKAREILNEEIDNISLDASRLNLLKRNGEVAWRQFIQAVRTQTAPDAQRGDLDDILTAWIETLSQKGRANVRRAA